MKNSINLETLFADCFYKDKAFWILVLVDEIHVCGLLVFEFQNLTNYSVFCIWAEASIELLHYSKLHTDRWLGNRVIHFHVLQDRATESDLQSLERKIRVTKDHNL